MGRPRPRCSDAMAAAVTAELIRLCLPHLPDTERPELNCPITEGRLYR